MNQFFCFCALLSALLTSRPGLAQEVVQPPRPPQPTIQPPRPPIQPPRPPYPPPPPYSS